MMVHLDMDYQMADFDPELLDRSCNPVLRLSVPIPVCISYDSF